jgi:murein L,D-transpeptidase YcbB/YkuD
MCAQHRARTYEPDHLAPAHDHSAASLRTSPTSSGPPEATQTEQVVRRPTGALSSPWFLGRLLRFRVSGPDVRLVQGRLVQIRVARLAVDGEFSAMASAAVTTFQRASHLEADGVVGLQTWKALWSSLDRRYGRGARHGQRENCHRT